MTDDRIYAGDHEQMAELMAADALDALTPTDQAQLATLRARHGADCPDCAALEAEFAETAADLASSLPARAPSSDAWDRLLAATTPTPATVAASRDVRHTAPGTGRRRVRRTVLAAAAAVVLLVAGGVIGYAVHPGTNGGSAVADYLGEPGVTIARFPTAGGRSLAVAYRPGHSGAWLLGSGLPAPSGSHVYELWFQASGSQQMRPAGTFTGGRVQQRTTISPQTAALAVSVEPHGGSPSPTTQPIYLLRLPG